MVCSRLFDFRWNTIYRKNNSKQNNIYIVTGTNKWGLSNGSIAAIIIKDLITKNSSEYEELYNPSRAKSYINGKIIKNSVEMAYNYIKGKINSGDDNLPQKGEWKIANINGERYGVYRDKKGYLYVVDIMLKVKIKLTLKLCDINLD